MKGSMMNGMVFRVGVELCEYTWSLYKHVYGGRSYRFSERAGEIPGRESVLCQKIFDDDVGNIDDDLRV